MGIYSARRTYDLGNNIAWSASGAFLSQVTPNTRGVPDNFRCDFLEIAFNSATLTDSNLSAADLTFSSFAEYLSVLDALCSSIRVHSTALGEVVQSVSLGNCVKIAMAAGLPVTIDSTLPMPGQTKAGAGSGIFNFEMTVRIPFFDPNLYRAAHCFESHQLADGGVSATFGAAAIASIGGITTYAVTAATSSIRLVGRDMDSPTKRSPWNYLTATSGTRNEINFEAGLYGVLTKIDESPNTVTDAGQYDLWIDGQQVLVKSQVRLWALLEEWLAARDYDGPGLVRRIIGGQANATLLAAPYGSPVNIASIPILWRDPRNSIALQPESSVRVQVETDSNFAAAATWGLCRVKPISRIGNGLVNFPASASQGYAPIPIR